MFWRMTGKRTAKAQKATLGRFEIEKDGEVASLAYSLTDDVIELIHTEVPEALRGKGIATQLADSALEWAREHKVKVDIICPMVRSYVDRHPEYEDLILK